MKPANNAAKVGAESVEPRARANGNPPERTLPRAQNRISVGESIKRIRQAARKEPKERLIALLHHVTPRALEWAYLNLKREATAGVDGVTWEEYGNGLEERLLDLHRRVQSGAYRARPSKRMYIPKPDGSKRPLGIAALEDKIVQKAVGSILLTPVYETEFLGFSYGFRPGKSAHNALDALAYALGKREINWILDADIAKFFDTLEQGQLLEFLEHRIGDRRVIQLIDKWLTAGVMEDGLRSDTGRGTPQGANVSPVLANVYL